MKKRIDLFCAAAMIAMTTGCVDYRCTTYYDVINQTNHDVTIEIWYGDKVYKSTTIESEDKKNIYDYGTLCSEGFVANDYYSDEEEIQDLFVTINGKSMPNSIWKRRYWNFIAIPYETIFTLTLTNELLEEMQQQKKL